VNAHVHDAHVTGLSSAISAAVAEVNALREMLSDEASRAVAGRFEWVDGSLSRAISTGGWVLLDNANLCNPTVLDRLNPLLEPGGAHALKELWNGLIDESVVYC
jgi:midasin